MAETTITSEAQAEQGLPPWQFFLLCGMLGATAVVIVATGQSLANVVILSITVVSASFVGLGAYRMLAPLVSQTVAGAPVVAGGRTRAALEREKTLVLRAIKELEFDFAMGKVARGDYDEMSGRLRRRAMGLIQQLEANAGYREQIEKELASLVPPSFEERRRARTTPGAQDPNTPRPQEPLPAHEERRRAGEAQSCAACGTFNDADARFCKQCGTSLKA